MGIANRILSAVLGRDDPYFRVEFEQSAELGHWKADLHLLGSRKAFRASFYVAGDVEVTVPSDMNFDGHVYCFPTPIATSTPLQLVLGCTNLSVVSGRVHFRFERKQGLGGVIHGLFVPIGIADPGLLERYTSSHNRNFEGWRKRAGG
jgi:hypothetical protein